MSGDGGAADRSGFRVAGLCVGGGGWPGAGRRPGRWPGAQGLIGRCGSGWGKAGGGPGAAEAAAPPLRPRRGTIGPGSSDVPGRNVPPQIMLYLWAGPRLGSTRRPGGRCARSPRAALLPLPPPLPPRARGGRRPAPAQVSPGRAPRPEGAGCR